MKENHSDIIRQLDNGAALDADMNQGIVDACIKYREEYLKE
jgi:hypothetical protein